MSAKVIGRLWPSISEWFQRKLKVRESLKSQNFYVSLIHLDFSDFLSWFCEAELEPQLKEQLMDIVEFEDISRSLQIFLYFLVAAKARQGPWSWHLSHAP